MVKIIAEIGMNHDGSLGQAKAFIQAAAECGVDAVKFQTHIADAETLLDAPRPKYFQDESRYEYFKRTAFTKEQHLILKKFAEELKVEFISSPFSIEAVDLLLAIGIETIKIPSGEVTNLPYLRHIAKSKKNVLLSTGMSSWDEITLAYQELSKLNSRVTVLQCTSEYPCPPEKAGLNNLQLLKERFHCEVGFSDHTFGSAAAIVAVTMGASVVEKHFTISNQLYGPDAKFSATPQEMKRLVEDIRAAEKLVSYAVDKDEECAELKDMKITFEKSIVSKKTLCAGTILSEDDLAYKKPGNGINARDYEKVIGKKVVRDISVNAKLAWSDLE